MPLHWRWFQEDKTMPQINHHSGKANAVGLPARWLAHSSNILLLTVALLLPSLAACNDKPVETTGTTITGLDHLAEHLSIQNFWVNSTAGQQAGRGGSQVCCVSIPEVWQPGLKVNVKWAVTNWKRRAYTKYEKNVPVEHCKEAYPGRLWIHFLADGEVRAVSCDVGPGFYEKNAEYPGPQPLSNLPKKQPWEVYPKAPGEPLFLEIPNAMEDDKK
jgi:Protein of unknown function (DUF3304)